MKKTRMLSAAILMLLAALLSISACKKDSNNNASPTATSGTIQFVNNSTNPYAVYIDGTKETTLSGKTSRTFSVDYGAHVCRVIQQSGYVVYATDQSYNVVLNSSTTSEIVSFP